MKFKERFALVLALLISLPVLVMAQTVKGLPFTVTSFAVPKPDGLYSCMLMIDSNNRVVSPAVVYRVKEGCSVSMSYDLQQKTTVIEIDGKRCNYSGTPLLLWSFEERAFEAVLGNAAELCGGRHESEVLQPAIISWILKRGPS